MRVRVRVQCHACACVRARRCGSGCGWVCGCVGWVSCLCVGARASVCARVFLGQLRALFAQPGKQDLKAPQKQWDGNEENSVPCNDVVWNGPTSFTILLATNQIPCYSHLQASWHMFQVPAGHPV